MKIPPAQRFRTLPVYEPWRQMGQYAIERKERRIKDSSE